jgi:hypothetical protein
MAFNLPAQTSLSLRRPTTQSAAWVRPADWPTITDDPNKVQFLYADTFPTCSLTADFLRTTASANLYIDWGDGSAPTTQSSADYPYVYSHNYTPGTGATSSLGYSTFVISVFTDESASIALAKPAPKNSILNQFYVAPYSFLEAYYGDNTMQQSGTSGDTLNNAFYGNTTTTQFSMNMLQYAKLPRNYPLSSINNIFTNAADLRKVDMPLTMSVFSMNGIFSGCVNLQSVTLSDNVNSNSWIGTFNNCYSLTSVTLPSVLSTAINLSALFSNCVSLTSVKLPYAPACTDYSQTFLNCQSLLEINIPTFYVADAGPIINLSQFAFGANALQYVTFPNTATSGSRFSCPDMFRECASLISMVIPEYFSGANNFDSVFWNNNSISSIVLPSTMPSVTRFNETFRNCYNLQNITLPSTVGASISLASTFFGCRSLSNVVIPESYNITTLSNTFESCRSLNSVSLPTGSQNSIGSLARAFYDCYALQSVTFPSSMTGVGDINAMFSNAQTLKTALLPTGSMNSCTTAQLAFSACTSLENLTFPTSMSACTNFINTWNGCASLRGNNGSTSSFYLPVSVANTVSYDGSFVGCFELAGVTFPTNQVTGSTNGLRSMFTGCPSLKTITNLEKYGSPLTTGTVINAATFNNNGGSLSGSLSFTPRLSKLELQGNSATYLAPLSGLRLTNTGSGQWGGTSPQINISNNDMSTAALNTLFADMAAQPVVTSKVINISNCTGAAGLTVGDRLVITSRGWTITG